VAKRFEAAGYDPSGYTLYSYAAVQIFAQAAAAANAPQPGRILAAMKGREFGTGLGPIRFDAKGDREGAAYRVYAWRNGSHAETE
jgi:branched-chain amino acid transport system substrate-binding protein